MLVKIICVGAILLGVLHAQKATAQDWSANIGYNRDYIYRGVPQKSSSALAGNYYEAGYGNNLSVKDVDLFDYALALIYSDSTLLGSESDTNIVLTLSKTFSF